MARHRSISGPGPTTCLRVRPVDSLRVISALEFLEKGRQFLGLETFMAGSCLCCQAADIDTRHARTYHRAGAQVDQHQQTLGAGGIEGPKTPSSTGWRVGHRSVQNET